MILIDTNVLVYVHDTLDPVKQRQAGVVLDALIRRSQAAISVQSIAEFFSVVTRRRPPLIEPEAAVAYLQRLVSVCPVLPLTPSAALAASAAAVSSQISIWDAQIWAVAREHGVGTLLTEDAPHGMTREGVVYLNPFDPTFDIGDG